jgi:hypothetical protein
MKTNRESGRSPSSSRSPAMASSAVPVPPEPVVSDPMDAHGATQAAPARPIETFRILYDATLRRPGCVLLQAVAGCAVPNFQSLFPSETWLVELTDDMKVYRATREELRRLSEITRPLPPTVVR